MNTVPRTGLCICGSPVADHFDRHNRKLSCEALALKVARPLTVGVERNIARLYAEAYKRGRLDAEHVATCAVKDCQTCKAAEALAKIGEQR